MAGPDQHHEQGLNRGPIYEVQTATQGAMGATVDAAGRMLRPLDKDLHEALPFTDRNTYDKLQSLEAELRAGSKQQIYTRVESWVLDQQPKTMKPERQGAEALNFRLWKTDYQQARRDLHKLGMQFPEFAVSIGILDAAHMPSSTDTPLDPKVLTGDMDAKGDSYLKDLAALLSDKLENRWVARQQYRTQLDYQAKEVGGGVVGEYLKNFGTKFTQWGQRGEWYKQVGAVGIGVLLAAGIFKGSKALLEGVFGSDNPLITWAAAGGTVAAMWGGYEAVTGNFGTPERTAKSPNVPREVGPDYDDLKPLEQLLATDEGVQSVMFSFRTPTRAVLEMYRDRHGTMGTKPFRQYFGGEGVYSRRQKEMLAVINKNPQMQERMYKFVDGVVQTFETSPNYQAQLAAKKSGETLTVLDFLNHEYVEKYHKNGEHSEFYEVIEDAMEIERKPGLAATLQATQTIAYTTTVPLAAPIATTAAAPAAKPPEVVKIGKVEFKTGDTIKIKGTNPMPLLNVADFKPASGVTPLQPGIEVAIDDVKKDSRGNAYAEVEIGGQAYLLPLHPAGKPGNANFEKVVVAPSPAAAVPPVAPPPAAAMPPPAPPTGGGRRGSAPAPRP